MSTTKALSGLRPSRKRGGSPNSQGMNEYPIQSGKAANFFTGDIVCNDAGYVVALSAVTQKALGVFMGCRYVANGVPTWSQVWPSGTSATDAYALVMDDPSATFEVQADASCTIGDMNSLNFDVTLGAGSTVTGRSGFGVKAASRTTGSAMLRAISAIDEPGNDINVGAERAYPKLEVRIVRHIDAYISADASAN